MVLAFSNCSTSAKKEGWSSKTGSKWATMPELMIRYRAAAFWGRLYASDLLLGLQSQEEVVDVELVNVSTNLDELNAKIQPPAAATPVVQAAPEVVDELF